MAGYVGNNYGIQRPEGNNNTNNNRLILKEELRRQWYVYTTTADTEFRAYPVFDMSGSPCPPIGDTDADREVDILPESFAALRVATYAGVNKNLEFVDMCSDIQRYNTEGVGYLKTPYEYLVLAMQRMSPKKNDRTSTMDGYPMPRQLEPIATPYGVANSANCIVVRGALLKHGGKPLTTQSAVGGMLPTAVILIRQQGAITSLYKMLGTTIDPSQPLSPGNTIMRGMFALNGDAFSVVKASAQSNKGIISYDLVKTYDQTFAMKMSQATKTQLSDDISYWGALRAMFGNYQSVGDIFHIMTVEQMVAVLKENYPISWLWYAWKDSPYAGLVTPDERQEALRDPEMAARFGVSSTPVAAPSYQNPVSGDTTPPQPTYPTNQSQPNWNSPAYGGGGQVGGIQQPAPVGQYPSASQLPPAYPSTLGTGGGDVQPQAVTNDAMKALEAKYSGNDGLKY